MKSELISLSNDKEYSKILNSMADTGSFSEVELSEYKEIHQTILNYSKGIYSLVPGGIKIKKLMEDYSFN
jgi:hypothetical protein